ncbi:hypothetical protein IVA95_37715 [Bradyrhizobium sp. 157]|uniref:hypothetical protein n=1 Tax=Bradyrhizobium sp. 157 TaxID=2782631 RepID=UPI001FF8F8B0|nr:hypothetical protein [Bradyrhizobium sp. 157]MCK1643145.1 hypothetical protein [Bradyrhizobium sp. 157]
MPHEINHGRRHFISPTAATLAARKLFAPTALAAIILLMLVQFGPLVVFSSKPTETSLVRVGAQ